MSNAPTPYDSWQQPSLNISLRTPAEDDDISATLDLHSLSVGGAEPANQGPSSSATAPDGTSLNLGCDSFLALLDSAMVLFKEGSDDFKLAQVVKASLYDGPKLEQCLHDLEVAWQSNRLVWANPEGAQKILTGLFQRVQQLDAACKQMHDAMHHWRGSASGDAPPIAAAVKKGLVTRPRP